MGTFFSREKARGDVKQEKVKKVRASSSVAAAFTRAAPWRTTSPPHMRANGFRRDGRLSLNAHQIGATSIYLGLVVRKLKLPSSVPSRISRKNLPPALPKPKRRERRGPGPHVLMR
jgi:hypothetical protein